MPTPPIERATHIAYLTLFSVLHDAIIQQHMEYENNTKSIPPNRRPIFILNNQRIFAMLNSNPNLLQPSIKNINTPEVVQNAILAMSFVLENHPATLKTVAMDNAIDILVRGTLADANKFPKHKAQI